MKKTMPLTIALTLGLAACLSACDKPASTTVVAVPVAASPASVQVPVPGPPGPQGEPGKPGEGTTVIVAPQEPASAASSG